jgi:hypothetical protein
MEGIKSASGLEDDQIVKGVHATLQNYATTNRVVPTAGQFGVRITVDKGGAVFQPVVDRVTSTMPFDPAVKLSRHMDKNNDRPDSYYYRFNLGKVSNLEVDLSARTYTRPVAGPTGAKTATATR